MGIALLDRSAFAQPGGTGPGKHRVERGAGHVQAQQGETCGIELYRQALDELGQRADVESLGHDPVFEREQLGSELGPLESDGGGHFQGGHGPIQSPTAGWSKT